MIGAGKIRIGSVLRRVLYRQPDDCAAAALLTIPKCAYMNYGSRNRCHKCRGVKPGKNSSLDLVSRISRGGRVCAYYIIAWLVSSHDLVRRATTPWAICS